MGFVRENVCFRVLPESEAGPMPVSLRSVGHYIVAKSWADRLNIVKDFVEVFWCIEGDGEFCIEGKNYLLSPGCVTYYYRKESHIIRAVSSRWQYRWFTFDGPLANELMKSFNYPRKPFYAGVCPEELFMKLAEDIRDLTPYGLRKAGATVYALLAAAGGRGVKAAADDLLAQQVLEFIEENYGNETVNVNTIADVLKISRSTLNRKFQAKMQMPPGDYLCHVRVQKALSLLRATNLTAMEIGLRCGMPNPCYFSKVIKKFTGMPPGNFRKQ
ncbi:MAG: AraC family transcriptional regulator [Victivallaceae bacterium]